MALTATFAADMSGFLRSLQDAQVQLQVFDRATKNAARSLTRDLESFSGQKIAAEAARVAEAVQRVGGASKLTEAEQRRVNATVTEAIAKYAALGQEAPESLKRLASETTRAERSTSALSSTIGRMAASFTVANLATTAIEKAASSLGDFVARGGQVAPMRSSFEALAGGAEKAAARLDIIRQSTQGLVSDFDAMAAANKAMLLDLGLSDAQMGSLAKTAMVLGRAMGQDATKSLDDLITALGRSSPMILDNLGLSVKVGEANEAYARALGKTADALTDAERKQAFMNAAMTAAEEKVRTLGTQQLTAADRAGQLWRGFKDLADATASWVVQLGPVNYGLGKLVEGMHLWETLFRTGKLSETVREYARMTGAALPPLPPPPKGYDVAATNVQALAMSEREMAAADRELTASVKDKIEAFEAFNAELRQFGGADAAERGAEIVRIIGALGGPLKVLPSQVAALAQGLREAAEAARIAGDADLATQYEALARTLEPVVLLQQRYNVTIGEFVTPMEDFTQAVLDQNDALQDTRTLYIGIVPAVATATSAMVPFKEAAESAVPALKRTADELARLESAARRREAATALREISAALADLAQSTGRTGGLLGDIAELIGLMGVGAEAGNQFTQALESIGETGQMNAAAFTQMVSTLVTMIATMERATDVAGQMNRTLRGAAVGAQIGAQVGGAKGAAIGATIGGLIGFLRNPAFEDVMQRVGRDWGVQISEGLARGIAEEAKKNFGGSRQAAEIFNLDKIIAEGGGLNASNLDRMASKLRDVFVLLQTGAFSAAQAADVLGRNWQAFVDAGTDASGRLAPALVEIIRLTRELGVVSKEVQGYLLGQSSAALDGLNAIVNASKAQFDTWREVGERVKEAQARIDELNKVEERGRGADWAREMAAAQADLNNALADQKNAAAGGAAELENLARIAMGTYAAAIEAGMSHNEAMRAAAPAMAQLIQAYEHLGISVEDAGLKAFLAQAKFVEANPEIIAGIDGLAQSMIALSNMGLLTAETFGHMQEAGLRMYERLLAEAEKMGLEGDEASRAALLPMQEYLREAARQAELLGIPLDEATQKLIDQSKELGIWRDKGKDPMEDMRDAVREMRDAVKDLVDELRKIPANVTSNVKVRYTREGDAGPGGGSGTDSGPGPSATAGPSRASVATASRAATSGVIRVPVYIDGREVAHASAPYRRDAERAWGAD